MGFWTRVRLPSIPFFMQKYTVEVFMDENKFIVDQYIFETEEEYELALSEKKKIQYIDEHTDYRAVENIAVLYKRLVATNMFQTPVGYAYLDRLREFLVRSGAKTDNFPGIPVKKKISLAGRKELMRENRKLQEELERRKRNNSIAITVCIAFAMIAVALFAVAFTSKHPNILNYENVILDKYSSWEQELTERENAVREKELALEVDE